MSGEGVGPRVWMSFGPPLTCAIGVVTSVCPVTSSGVALDAGVCALAALMCRPCPSCAECCPNEAHSANTRVIVLVLQNWESKTVSAAGLVLCERTCNDQLVAIPNRIACVVSDADYAAIPDLAGSDQLAHV